MCQFLKMLQRKSRKKEVERLEEAFVIMCHLSRNSKGSDLCAYLGEEHKAGGW